LLNEAAEGVALGFAAGESLLAELTVRWDVQEVVEAGTVVVDVPTVGVAEAIALGVLEEEGQGGGPLIGTTVVEAAVGTTDNSVPVAVEAGAEYGFVDVTSGRVPFVSIRADLCLLALTL